MFVVPQALKSVVMYAILAPYDNEQSDLVHRISADKKLEEIPKYRYGTMRREQTEAPDEYILKLYSKTL